MNHINSQTKSSANEEAIFNVYSYVANKGEKPVNGDSFGSIVSNLRKDYENNRSSWNSDEIHSVY